MVLNNFREHLGKFINRPVRFFVKHEVTPNQLSFVGFLLCLTVAVMLGFDFLHNFWLAGLVPLTMLASGAFDVFDGAVARETGKNSAFGGFLDSTLDRFSDAAIFLGLVLGGYCHVVVGFLSVASALLISYVRSRAEFEGVDMKGVGFLERAERFFILMGAAVADAFIYAFTDGTFANPNFSYWNFFWWFSVIFLVLMDVTIAQRVVYAYRALKKVDLESDEPRSEAASAKG
ncbi:MAG: archaetidylinositol phosphate synthase [Promethearchaeota archaeon]